MMSSKARCAFLTCSESWPSKTTVGWKLPSPAWPTMPIVSPQSAEICSTRSTRSANRSRHADVVDHRGAELLHRGQHLATTGKQQFALSRVVGHRHLDGAGLFEHLGHRPDLGRGTLSPGVRGREHEGAGVGGDTHVEGLVDRLHGHPVHELQE